jgi:dCMP deaminase
VRLTRDQWGMSLARLTAKRSTCLRRQVGCVLIDERGHVLATGYNGVASGLPHCNEKRSFLSTQESSEVVRPYRAIPSCLRSLLRTPEVPGKEYPNACPGAQALSGQNLDGCHAIHAEQNAILQCTRPFEIWTAYVTTSPCISCVKMLMNTSCARVVFDEQYIQTESRDLWLSRPGRYWTPFKD